ncbi:bifunctional GTP diphosphokinase/guanosine-3',5'-bis pyrophosphate 3'-pyrophosphohydrolase [Halorhodospira halochloris]|uniref:bifunctional GTP diphosphokinase/guanosine-3',5'-bis pyrophosphate 3'-pyrophosphohydrolase n=1 Tax=Halorhodospira halochloris TaxID=1052 RepID=UPI001EE7E317|nr:bifunctional GTP diphosphokinase/guanosine-3',5'-bis pyrophosphate 3'-pyrophosphohydrolase [Halorhodospira halochloris]MCG5529404.1 bifunctional GTP diphosphokinase/guanosine-3',5'-bis pyrophosphate 3'-pyrophosphohydrolase [Halorhodospira halochloris]
MARAASLIADDDSAALSDPQRRLGELLAELHEYLDSHQVERVEEAYRFSAAAHEGQRRRSGEPYIVHPVAVARILAEMRLDEEAIVAALLHDVIEDTPTAKEGLVDRFGEQVAELVDGVSKLTAIDGKSKAEAQAQSFRKMIMAMTQDIRVILIKLADRLHNMRTIWIMPPQKRRQIARETLEIYAPIAQRLGINAMRIELEDLGFAALYPLRYRALKEKLARQRGRRGVILDTVCDQVRSRLSQMGIEAKVEGREKHLWSIYCKMLHKQLNFRDVFDVYGFRVVVDSVDECYRVLGILHNLYKPRPGRIKDYIAIPKANGYQSLHTTLVGPHRIRLEAQIRTGEMDAVAESGIAAHWLYKDAEEGSNKAQIRAREWVQHLLEMQRSAGNSEEFIESVKIDLVPDEIYVFTPKGDIIELPHNATPVDLAYAIHSDVGNSCVAAKVDHRLTPLRTPLKTGQMIEIVTAPVARPNPVWLDFVVTAKARTAIRHALKRLEGEEAVDLGRRMVERALAALSLDLEQLDAEHVEHAVEKAGADSLEQLFKEVGLGRRVPWLVAQLLSGLEQGAAEFDESIAEQGHGGNLTLRGNEGAVVNFGRCCRPIPGDPIVGFVSSGRGVVIHHRDCKNVGGQRKRYENWIDVDWEAESENDFPAQISIDVVNERGALAQLAYAIAERGSSIENVTIEERDGMIATVRFLIMVRDRRHLASIMRHLRAMSVVQRISRKVN